jgi:hypothetical protein
MLGGGFGYAIQHSLEIILFFIVLNLNNNQLFTRIQGQNINPIKFIGFGFLIRFRLQNSISGAISV